MRFGSASNKSKLSLEIQRAHNSGFPFSSVTSDLRRLGSVASVGVPQV